MGAHLSATQRRNQGRPARRLRMKKRASYDFHVPRPHNRHRPRAGSAGGLNQHRDRADASDMDGHRYSKPFAPREWAPSLRRDQQVHSLDGDTERSPRLDRRASVAPRMLDPCWGVKRLEMIQGFGQHPTCALHRSDRLAWSHLGSDPTLQQLQCHPAYVQE